MVPLYISRSSIFINIGYFCAAYWMIILLHFQPCVVTNLCSFLITFLYKFCYKFMEVLHIQAGSQADISLPRSQVYSLMLIKSEKQTWDRGCTFLCSLLHFQLLLYFYALHKYVQAGASIVGAVRCGSNPTYCSLAVLIPNFICLHNNGG